jgi:DNA-binding response OmpR family regulator
MQSRTKELLYVENVIEELDYFRIYKGDLQNKTGYYVKLDTARTVDEAINKIAVRKFDALLLDMMLPKDEKTLTALNKKESEREQVWIRYNTICSNPGDREHNRLEIKELREKINQIDEDIDKMLNMEGGLEIARYYINKHGKMPVIFFTALGDESLSEKCKHVVGEELYGYIEKPATVEEVYTQFVMMWDKRK